MGVEADNVGIREVARDGCSKRPVVTTKMSIGIGSKTFLKALTPRFERMGTRWNIQLTCSHKVLAQTVASQTLRDDRAALRESLTHD